jgi:tetratricopeptide (TPR) repeat protein
VYYALLGAALMGALASGAALLLGVDGEIYGDADSDVTRNPQFRRAMRARAAGRPREAMELLSSFLATDPDAYEAALALHEVARQARRAADARAALLRVIRIELDRELAAAAVDHWLELIEDGIPEKADPVLLIHMALLLREEGRREEAVDALRCALERSEDRASHVVAARIARAARGLDPGVVETAAWRALGFIELELEERQALENLIAEALESTRGRSTVAEAPSRERPTATDEFELPTATDTPSLERSTVADPSSREHPAAATDVHALPEAPSSPAASPEFEIGSERSLDVVLAVPLELTDDGIEIQTLQGQKKLVRYERIQAVAVSAVHGLSSKPVLIVDLVLNWTSPANETLRVIRLRSDRFEPRRLCPDDASSVGALRSLVKILIERSDATPLPDREASNGRPFASYDDSETYHREVLLVEGTASSES